jgi:hypothetical protein
MKPAARWLAALVSILLLRADGRSAETDVERSTQMNSPWCGLVVPARSQSDAHPQANQVPNAWLRRGITGAVTYLPAWFDEAFSYPENTRSGALHRLS